MKTPVALYVLLIANGLVYLLEGLVGPRFVDLFALWPLGHGFMPWQVASSAFLHASPSHLAINLFGLWMFGRDVERALGSARFLALFLASVLGAALAQLATTAALGVVHPTVGASGALFGILGAYGWMFPRSTIVLLIPPVPMPAWLFVILYAGFELYAGVTGTQEGIAHFAHLGGLVAGLALLPWLRGPERPGTPPGRITPGGWPGPATRGR